ncbi:MAG: carboxylating nicotinate-nucleotide diphosphorylase [Bacteroidales bacterium]|nr:carboxylating nicotinate-nucleotide diphosphorylase [Bacteroidales bacterium]
MNVNPLFVDDLIRLAVIEDLGAGDHTSLATIPENANGKAMLLVKEDGIIAGIEIASKVFHEIDPEINFIPLLKDGDKVCNGDVAFTVEGKSVSLLSAERLALNFLQRMSGIATKTNQLVSLLNGLPTKLLDTRKTTPNMRVFEKEAVRIGGGYNHRFGLYDMILIKNNHIDFAGGVIKALEACFKYLKLNKIDVDIEIEVRNLDELNQAISVGGFKRIMLDNFSVEEMRRAVSIIGHQFETEASGGINETTLRAYAETGVNYISVGALTHHIKSLDMSLRAVV